MLLIRSCHDFQKQQRTTRGKLPIELMFNFPEHTKTTLPPSGK